jgi:preprotein translocase subunit SecB
MSLQETKPAGRYTVCNIWLKNVEFVDSIRNDHQLLIMGRVTLKNEIKDDLVLVQLTFEMKDEAPDHDSDFLFRAKYDGCFQIVDGKPAISAENFSKANAPATIFPFVRELLMNMTMRSSVGPLLMPMINFVEMAESGEAVELLRLGTPEAPKQMSREQKPEA